MLLAGAALAQLGSAGACYDLLEWSFDLRDRLFDDGAVLPGSVVDDSEFIHHVRLRLFQNVEAAGLINGNIAEMASLSCSPVIAAERGCSSAGFDAADRSVVIIHDVHEVVAGIHDETDRHGERRGCAAPVGTSGWAMTAQGSNIACLIALADPVVKRVYGIDGSMVIDRNIEHGTELGICSVAIGISAT